MTTTTGGRDLYERPPLGFWVSYGLFLAVLLIFARGYAAYINDHYWNLLPAIASEEHVLQTDWFTQSVATSSVRMFSALSLAALKIFIPSMDGRLIALQAVSTALFVGSILYLLSVLHVSRRFVLPIATLMILGTGIFTGAAFTYPAWENYYVPRVAGTALLLISISSLVANRIVLAGIFGGLAMLIHPSTGLTGLCTLGVTALLQNSRPRIRTVAVISVLVLGIGAASLVPVLLQQLSAVKPDIPYPILDLFIFRQPMILPSNWNPVRTGVLILVTIHAYLLLRNIQIPEKRTITIVISVILTLAVLQSLGIQFLYLESVYKTMLAPRLLPVFRTLYLALLGVSILQEWSSDRRTSVVRFLVIATTIFGDVSFMPVLALDVARLAVRDSIPRIGWLVGYGVTAVVALAVFPPIASRLTGVNTYEYFSSGLIMILGTGSVLTVGRYGQSNSAAHNRERIVLLAASAALGAVILGSSLLSPGSAIAQRWQYSEDQTVHSDQMELAVWTRHHTSPDIQILTPPWNSSFRLLSRRAIYADFKGVPVTDADIVEWHHRLYEPYRLKYGSVPPPRGAKVFGIRQAYEDMTPETVLTIAKEYNLTHFVSREIREFPFEELHKVGRWRLYKLPEDSLEATRQ